MPRLDPAGCVLSGFFGAKRARECEPAIARLGDSCPHRDNDGSVDRFSDIERVRALDQTS